MSQQSPSLNSWQRHCVRRTVARGGVIAYPTEAVWGLGCDPWNREAVERILALKQRPWHKGLILVAGSLDQVAFLLQPLAPEIRQRALQHWPGPVTCVVPDPLEQIPAWVRGRHHSIAIRVSAHPLVQALCQSTGMPLVSTSCNPAGRQPARHAWQVRRYFADRLDWLVPGALGESRQPSQIIDITTGRRLR
ncbi:L-threonylcarbamoyladenylate synthase [Marinobacter xestospongiae]|uniref:L-threonylcarbamoyladenylate synthase n=1 Tax=Marinobacter xestospongiae TaxID=994319 RepID=UPI0020053519|nr:Sua5/YciO/YrdC/YwlC family protein [Marinobacter xestospongiae]MCK7567979.1 Sua5/YciO/YrdC/YwlC family protein [Marinobacter xestospongiae]